MLRNIFQRYQKLGRSFLTLISEIFQVDFHSWRSLKGTNNKSQIFVTTVERHRNESIKQQSQRWYELVGTRYSTSHREFCIQSVSRICTRRWKKFWERKRKKRKQLSSFSFSSRHIHTNECLFIYSRSSKVPVSEWVFSARTTEIGAMVITARDPRSYSPTYKVFVGSHRPHTLDQVRTFFSGAKKMWVRKWLWYARTSRWALGRDKKVREERGKKEISRREKGKTWNKKKEALTGNLPESIVPTYWSHF